MSLNKLFSALALVTITAAPAVAADLYAGGGITKFNLSQDGLNDDAQLSGVFGKFGMEYTENLAAEVRVGLGYGESQADGIDWSLKNFVGLYAKGGIELGSIYPYAIAGYTRGEFSADSGSVSGSDSESDVSFGAGLDILATDELKIGIEYMNYIEKDGGELDGFTFSLQKSF